MKIEDHPAFHGWNATVKCVSAENSEAFEENRIYHIVNGDFKDELKGTLYGGNYESLEDLNDRCNAQFELAAAPDLPHICYVLGGEKTPLKIGETFEFREQKYRVEKDGISYDDNSLLWPPLQALFDMVNHPEEIIRRPQFSEDEKALMRLLVKNGLPWIGRDDDTDSLFAYTEKPTLEDGCFGSNGEEQGIPDCLMRQITFKSSPFDAAAYLESEEAK
jgi:hypothetical protein